jgi:hypothetical protein
LLKSLGQHSLNLGLVFHLLVKNAKSDIFEICHCLNLVFESHLLGLNIDQTPSIIIFINLGIHYPVCERKFLFFVESNKVALVVFYKDLIHLSVFKLLYGFKKLHLFQVCVINLFDLFILDKIRSFLEVNRVKE